METSGWMWYREADDAHAREDNARFRAVLGHCPTCIAVLDEEGRLVGYNAEFEALFPTPPRIGEPVGQLFDEGPRAMLAEVVALAGTRQRAAALITMRTTVGEEHEFEFLAATLPGGVTRSIGVVMAAGDRTERTHEEGERALLARAIADANCHGAITLAQAAMGHDVNNVLTTIKSTVASLRERCGTADPVIVTMLRELDEAAKLGAEVVARASVRSPAPAVRGETADVRECVERSARIVAPLARRAKVEIGIDAPSDARVLVGATELTQVVTFPAIRLNCRLHRPPPAAARGRRRGLKASRRGA